MRQIDVSVVLATRDGRLQAAFDIRLPQDLSCAECARHTLALSGLPTENARACVVEITFRSLRLRPPPEATLAALGIWDGASLRMEIASAAGPQPDSAPFDAHLAQHAQPTPIADVFERPPRLRFAAAPQTVDITAPETAPTAPAFSWPALLMPALFAAASITATALGAHGGGVTGYLFSGFTALTALSTALNHRLEQRRYAQTVQRRNERYRNYLSHKGDQLAAAAGRQRIVALESHPDLETCAARITRSHGIWMREPADPDFLQLRLGLGDAPLAVTLKPPSFEPLLKDDPLGDEALALCQAFHQVSGAPALLDARAARGIGLAGPHGACVSTASALALQLATHHMPDDARVALIATPEDYAAWSWLRWLPHAWQPDRGMRYIAQDAVGARRVLEALVAEPCERRGRVLLLLPGLRLCRDEPALARVLRDAPTLGVTPVFFADDVYQLPRESDVCVEFEGGRARVMLPGSAAPYVVDSVDSPAPQLCETSARTLAALTLRRTAAPQPVPTVVPLLSLWDTASADAGLLRGWDSPSHLSSKSLRVPIGRGAGGALLQLDLRDGDHGHGAHGLVAGTTGSGKSELLQTLIASLAIRFHPDWMAFLLIDYKGGGMANAFCRIDGAGEDGQIGAIPHLAGVITNLLDSASARRALIALESELKRRQRLFDAAGVTYIDAYHARYAARLASGEALVPLPRLVIIVDEFAELKRDQPEFMKQLISAARIGRSLGVHLILATQKPSGVVDDQIWSNSRFKLCLRVQDESDSKEMLRRPDAARLTRAGECVFMVGSHEHYETFQSAFGGAAYRPNDDPDAALRFVAAVRPDGSADPGKRIPLANTIEPAASSVRQLDVVTRLICEHARRTGAHAAARIFLDPLPAQLRHDDARLNCANGVAFGLYDDPSQRVQAAAIFDMAQHGHAMIFGQPGSGKTLLLQRFITALCARHGPDALNVYVLDFGGRALTQFAGLPQIGAVLVEDDDERIARLFRRLRTEMSQRRERLAGRKFDAALSAELRLPRIVTVIDNFPAFTRLDHEDSLTALVRDGAALGLHVLLSANKPLDIRARISGNIPFALTFALADRADYALVVGRTGGLEPQPLPGRGLLRIGTPLIFQAALPAAGDTDAERADAIAAFVAEQRANHAGLAAAPAILQLPDRLTLRELAVTPEKNTGLGVQKPLRLGISVLDLSTYELEFWRGPHIAITGTPQSGKTTLLRSIAHVLRSDVVGPYARVYAVDLSGSDEGLLHSAATLPDVQAVLDDADVQAMLTDIEARLAAVRAGYEHARAQQPGLTLSTYAREQAPLVVLVDEADLCARVLQRTTRERLDQLLERGARGLPLHVIVAGPDRALDAMDGWLKRIKDCQHWIVLGGLASMSFPLRLPPGERDKVLQAGQGYVAQRGQSRPVRVMFADSGGEGW
jgi:S-DNA-T family DNA segregation ATPase FtsK/SpoIIIE